MDLLTIGMLCPPSLFEQNLKNEYLYIEYLHIYIKSTMLYIHEFLKKKKKVAINPSFLWRSKNKLWLSWAKLKFRSVTLFAPTLLDSSRVPGGDRSAHPWIIAIGWQFYYFSLDRVLAMDVKGQNLKAQPSTFKTVAQRLFWKIIVFGEN